MCRGKQINMVDQCYDQNVNRTVQPMCEFNYDNDLFLGLIDVQKDCVLKPKFEVSSIIKDWMVAQYIAAKM